MSTATFAERGYRYDPSILELQAEGGLCIGTLGVDLPQAKIAPMIDNFARRSPLWVATERLTGDQVVLAVLYLRNSPIYYDEFAMGKATRANSGSARDWPCDFASFVQSYENRRYALLDPRCFKEAPVERFNERLLVRVAKPEQLKQKDQECPQQGIWSVDDPMLDIKYEGRAVFRVKNLPATEGVIDALTLVYSREGGNALDLQRMMRDNDWYTNLHSVIERESKTGLFLQKEEMQLPVIDSAFAAVVLIGEVLKDKFKLPASLPAASQ
jgi:hypothetical protein